MLSHSSLCGCLVDSSAMVLVSCIELSNPCIVVIGSMRPMCVFVFSVSKVEFEHVDRVECTIMFSRCDVM